LIVVVPKPVEKSFDDPRLENGSFTLLLLALPGFSFRVSARVSTRESINHSRHAIPSACSAIVGDPINSINPSSVSSHQM
jgi:hypothetical protein